MSQIVVCIYFFCFTLLTSARTSSVIKTIFKLYECHINELFARAEDRNCLVKLVSIMMRKNVMFLVKEYFFPSS